VNDLEIKIVLEVRATIPVDESSLILPLILEVTLPETANELWYTLESSYILKYSSSVFGDFTPIFWEFAARRNGSTLETGSGVDGVDDAYAGFREMCEKRGLKKARRTQLIRQLAKIPSFVVVKCSVDISFL
jgi:hypothetical protein